MKKSLNCSISRVAIVALTSSPILPADSQPKPNILFCTAREITDGVSAWDRLPACRFAADRLAAYPTSYASVAYPFGRSRIGSDWG